MYALGNAGRKLSFLACLITFFVIALLFWFEGGSTRGLAAASSLEDGGDAPTAVFAAVPASLGAIPDGTALSPLPSYGAARDVLFNVSGMSGTVQGVSVDFTSGGPAHTFRGDLEVTLIGPGGAPSHLLFSRTGATTATSFGSGSDLSGPYTFTDTAAGTHWWAVASTPTTPGSYRTVGPGPSASNPAFTSLNTTFAGILPNGQWTLRFRDGAQGDTGSISAANLTVTTGSGVQQHVLDFNGDGKTDWNVVRNIGGGSGGQVAWFTRYTGLASGQTNVFGISTDFFLSGDFDDDNKSDVAVWRPNASAAFFYILRSSDSTFLPIQWGITGDDPTVVGDYDGDGKTDCAVYRGGASAGQQSFWHIRKSSDGGYLPIQWGQNGDFPAPGDYDGDGHADAAVQRGLSGQGIFYIRYFNASFTQTVFGTSSDLILPGDYDADGKTDIAVARGIAGQISWFHDPSSIPGTQVVQTIWGVSATDFPTQGDYDGDGRTDQAIWRPSATPGQSAFFVNGSLNGFFAFQHGQQGDYPVANFNSH
jgi:hypothetical protein